METSIIKKAGEFLTEKSRRRYWQAGMGILGAAVIAVTAYVLSKPAQTLVRETYCGMEEHEHGESCYELVLSCGMEETGEDGTLENGGAVSEENSSGVSGETPEEGTVSDGEDSRTESGTGEGEQPSGESAASDEEETPAREEHKHGDECYTREIFLVCGQGDAPVHKIGCYAGYQELTCGQEESDTHIHTGECYGVEELRALVCGQQEGPEHTHVQEGQESCYLVVGAQRMICGQEESESHTHTDSCYELLTEEEFLCREESGQTVAEKHIHTGECYTITQIQNLICQRAETEGHAHGDECYTVTENDTLICGLEESAEHVHTDGCHEITEEKSLICGKAEEEAHVHGQECYETVEEESLICALGGTETPEGQEGSGETEEAPQDSHIHTMACCQIVANLSCGKEEYIPEETPAPEEENKDAEGGDGSSSEEAASGEENHNSSEGEVSGEEDSEASESAASDSEAAAAEEETETHIHTDECYEKVSVCEKEEHGHSEDCYRERYCGLTAHIHGESCLDDEENLICVLPEHAHQENCFREPHCGITAHIHTEGCGDETGELVCGMEEHTHTDDCFEGEPFYCGSTAHSHSEECSDAEGNIICGQADFVVHTHNQDCYNALGRLACPLPEIREHTHTADCFGQDGESAEPVCGLTEIEVHEHGEECRDEAGGLICGKTEIKVHIHSEDCHTELQAPEESEDEMPGQETEEAGEADNRPFYCQSSVHAHGEDCLDENGNRVCGKADFAAHVHTRDCYDGEGALICPLPEREAHVHGAECYGETSEQLEAELICEKEELKLHTHTEECYDENALLSCGKEEIQEHIHSEACRTESGEAAGTGRDITYYCLENVHQHTQECYDRNGGVICGEADYAAHTHTEKCYGAEEKLICPLPEVEAHEHSAECYPEGAEEPACGEEEIRLHSHTESCLDENGALICGLLEVAEHIHSEDCEVSHKPVTRIYQGENFVVTAVYGPEANIPEEAELIAEQITAESDGEHYAERQTQYQEALGDDKATMRALLKIGFYVNGQEVEPESPVTVTVQFLNENGLAEGKAVTVIHFAEEGTELLEGSKVEDGSTTFEMDSFSEIAVGYGVENVKVPLDETIDYETDAFHITFHIKGDVTMPIEEKADADPGEETDGALADPVEEADTVPADSGEETDGTPADSGEETDGTPADPVEENGLPEEDGESGSEEESPEAGPEEGRHITGTTEGNLFTAPVAAAELAKDFVFKVEALAEDSEEYAAVKAYGEEVGDGGAELLVQVWSYSLNYGDAEVDLSDCRVTAEFTPTQELVDVAKEAAVMAIGEMPGMADGTPDGQEENSSADTGDSQEGTEPEGEQEADQAEDPGRQDGFVISVMGLSGDAEINGIETATISEDSVAEEVQPIVIALETGYFAARASGQPNPKFTVQYYANLEKVAYNDDSLMENIAGGYTNELPVIDTDGGSVPGNGITVPENGGSVPENGIAVPENRGKLPENGGGLGNSPNGKPIRSLYVDPSTGKLKTRTVLTEVYTARPFEYHKAPTINYINALIENSSYELKKVWVLKEGKPQDSQDSIVESDWDIYDYDDKLHFTNRELSGGVEDGHTYVYIADNAVIRLVYDTTSNDKDFAAAFYDYDIGDGRIYADSANAQSGSGGQPTSNQGTGTWYMRTGQQGINSAGNYTGSGAKLAFGNSNSGSGLQHEKWSGNLLNKNNSTQGGHPTVAGSYKGCTFGLAAELVNGKIQYADGVIAPNLFNEGAAAGKTAYNEFSLKFNRVGDTHTLTAVNGAETGNLDSFNHPSPNDTTVHNHIWTNNFWPMDYAGSFGTDGHDMKFGDYGRRTKNKFAGQAGSGGGGATATGDFPWSDDGQDHNSYFGMHYKVQFELVADYVGPLEYYFFGDDDMWVFLGDGDGNGRLVCDIGGVHSSVGEYLNLWDYIDKDEEKIHRHEDTCYTNGRQEPPTCGWVDSKKFTLNFFYTERGESGSTCWMQFTLPSVSSLTPETTDDDFGHLEVRKTVKVIADGKEYSPEELFAGKEQLGFFEAKEFNFTLKLQGPSGSTLKDDYAYLKYDKNGNPMTDGSGILAWETIANGEKFTLKNGEYIRIQFLPVGTTYTILEEDGTEIQGVVYSGTEVNGDGNTPGDNELEVQGTVPKNNTHKVEYINKYSMFKLPETGGSGTTLYTMAGGIIVLLGGAGLMYRKKFRERRGEGDISSGI